ncbi:MAG: methyltransferase domain-containing protein [Steroidobacteraceae bacterium]
MTGAQYVQQITALESDRCARSAFQNRVLTVAPPGAALLDFGAGTGMDARFYAERGFGVSAYDVDPQMREFFAMHCRDLIDAGRITVHAGGYRDFIAAKGVGDVDLITSNFAPLNLIEDLTELFAKFHALTRPGGRVLASVLSPYFGGDLKYGWWWRNSWRLWSEGHFAVPGAQAPIVRRRLAEFAARSAPYFKLTRVFRGLPPLRERDCGGVDGGSDTLRTAMYLSACRFMFLLFEKRP